MRGVKRGEFLRLDMNENVDGLPEAFLREALSDINGEFLSMYPEYDGLIDRIAAREGIQPNQIFLCNGSDGAIKNIFDAFVEPDDRIVITDPTFAMYPVYAGIFNAHPIAISYDSLSNFPLEQFLSAITPETRAAVLVNPNNPLGCVVTEVEMSKILEKCEVNDVLLVVDEAYYHYYDETFIHQINESDHLIVLRTFSKLCAIASLRVGFSAACDSIVGNLEKVRSSFDINGFGVYLASKILDNPEVVNQMRNTVEGGRRFLLSALKNASVEHVGGNGNFILIDCGEHVSEVRNHLKENKILVAGGFTQSFLKNYIRVTLASAEKLERFWKIFQYIIGGLN